MVQFVKLTLAATGTRVLVNAENITCILPEKQGARVFFVSSDDDKIDVVETVEDLGAMLGAKNA